MGHWRICQDSSQRKISLSFPRIPRKQGLHLRHSPRFSLRSSRLVMVQSECRAMGQLTTGSQASSTLSLQQEILWYMILLCKRFFAFGNYPMWNSQASLDMENTISRISILSEMNLRHYEEISSSQWDQNFFRKVNRCTSRA